MNDIDEMSTIVIANQYTNVREFQDIGFFKSIRLRMDASDIKEPYKQHVWTHACVKSIATAIASVPFIIVKDTKNTTRAKSRVPKMMEGLRQLKSDDRWRIGPEELRADDFEVVDSGPLYDTFADVNPIMTRAQLWEATSIFLSMDGDCYWILRDKDGDPISGPNDWPAQIWPMGQNKVVPYVKDKALLGWRWRDDPQDMKRFELWQVVWFYEFNPYDPLDGLGDYETVEEAAQQDFSASKFNQAFIKNGAEPGGIITVPGGLNEKQREDILRTWNDRHKGPEKEGKSALLTDGAKYDRNPRTHVDMQFLEGRKWNRDETFAGFRVPKIMASIYEDINMATAFAAMKQFWENVVMPRMVYVEDLINSKLMNKPDSAGFFVMFDLSGLEALRADQEKMSQTAERYSKIGVPTADIIDTMELKFPKRGWQSSWWTGFGQVPISDKDSEDTENPAQGKPESDTVRKLRNASASLQTRIDKGKQWLTWLNTVLLPVEKPYQKKIRTFWHELRREQLALWEEATKALPSEGELNGILFNRDVWGGKLAEISLPFYEETSKLALEETAGELDTEPWKVDDPRIAKLIQDKANKIRIVTDEFWNALRENILEGMGKSETVTEVSQRIRQQFNNAQKPYATLRIARTEVAQMASMVRHENLKGEGVKKKEWNTAGDSDVREDHVILGTLGPVSLDHNYMTDLGKSGTLRFPSDPDGPTAQVIQCRCVELPVIK